MSTKSCGWAWDAPICTHDSQSEQARESHAHLELQEALCVSHQEAHSPGARGDGGDNGGLRGGLGGDIGCGGGSGGIGGSGGGGGEPGGILGDGGGDEHEFMSTACTRSEDNRR